MTISIRLEAFLFSIFSYRFGFRRQVKNIDTKQSNKRNNQNSKDKRQDYNMK